MSITLRIYHADQSLERERVDSLKLPGQDGSFSIYPNHMALLSILEQGTIWYTHEDKKKEYPLSSSALMRFSNNLAEIWVD